MSTVVMSAVWPLKMPPTAKAVLVSIADLMNAEGSATPSIAHLCARTCFGRTAVIEALNWLEDHDYLIGETRYGRPNRYWLGQKLFHVTQPVREAHP